MPDNYMGHWLSMKTLLLILALILHKSPMMTICHDGETMTLPAKAAENHLDNHPSDYEGACVVQPTVPEPSPATPLFYTFLLTKDNPPTGWLSYCLLRSPSAPSVEIQARLCGWVADNAPCAAMVWDTGYWYCDVYGHYRR
jgi:hypothetical protein